jgi:flagellin
MSDKKPVNKKRKDFIMSISIQTNVNSLVAQENLRVNSNFQSTTIQRLTSGYRINQSGDDAAGLAVANKYRSDTAELTQGVRNANDGISALQIIDGGLNNISKVLDRMKTLATQSASGTFTGDRSVLNSEFSSLRTELDRQANNINMNSGGSSLATLGVYIGGGVGAQANSTVQLDLGSMGGVDSSSLGVGTGVGVDGGTTANATSTAHGIVSAAPGVLAAPLSTGAAILAASGNLMASTQQISVTTQAGTTRISVAGGADGLTQQQLLDQVNAGLSGTGVTASITGNKIGFASADGFTVDVAAATNGSAGIGAADTFQNGFKHFEASVTPAALAQTISFTMGATTVNVAIAAGASVDLQETELRAGLKDSGIQLMRDGNNFSFQSKVAFTVTSDLGTVVDSLGLAAATPAAATGSYNGTTGANTANGDAALLAIESAVSKLGKVQGQVGAGQNTLQYAVNLAQSQISNFSSAESRIRDADVAAEAANLTKAQVLQQASMAAMAQANSAPQAVLALLRG